MSAPGCRFRVLTLCFQQVPRAEAAGYSRRNPEQSVLRSTAALSKGSRRRNLQQPCSTRAGGRVATPADAEGIAALGMLVLTRNAGPDAHALVPRNDPDSAPIHTQMSDASRLSETMTLYSQWASGRRTQTRHHASRGHGTELSASRRQSARRPFCPRTPELAA